MEYFKDGYTISTETDRQDAKAIHSYLTRSYWAEGIPLHTVARAINHSLCFGLFDPAGQQVGLVRVVTDYTTYAYLCDVFVLEEHRGRGLSKWLMECVMSYPDLQGLRRWFLATKDAHGLYSQFGFQPITSPERFMQIANPDIYKR
jgi:GNAT superfamily N-acetyltransferase